jgi:hypothetical protein
MGAHAKTRLNAEVIFLPAGGTGLQIVMRERRLRHVAVFWAARGPDTCSSMIVSENRYPPCIKYEAGFLGSCCSLAVHRDMGCRAPSTIGSKKLARCAGFGWASDKSLDRALAPHEGRLDGGTPRIRQTLAAVQPPSPAAAA